MVVAAAPPAEATVKSEFCTGSADVDGACRLATGPELPVEAEAAETKLTGLLVSRERFCGFRKRGAVTMFGAPPALANTRFPVASSDVIGSEPPEARAVERRLVGFREAQPWPPMSNSSSGTQPMLNRARAEAPEALKGLKLRPQWAGREARGNAQK